VDDEVLDLPAGRRGRRDACFERGRRRFGNRLALRRPRHGPYAAEAGRERDGESPAREPKAPWLEHLVILSLVAGLGAAVTASAAQPGVISPRLRPVVGTWRSALVEVGDTLLDVAYRERLGYELVARLNPDVDEWIPDAGTIVRLPTRFVLPDAPEEGLVLNVPEMRLYDFRSPSGPEVFAAAVGDPIDPTPIGEFRIGEKRVNPTWNVPESIRLEKPELPARVPPGPDNPLGSLWMTLGTTSYGIHGTNTRWSIGRMATHGCVRLYEDEMARLFERTPSGTRIRIVYQPFKWGSDGSALFLEAHPDLYGRLPDPLAAALEVPSALGLLDDIALEEVARIVRDGRGAPMRVQTSEGTAVTTSTPPS
jgi:L,D-transpeptidase ErfK/SrfK